jgi:hypothetical protein
MKSTPKTYGAIALVIASVVCSEVVNAQTSLEFATGASNPTGNGPSVANQVITFQTNSNNPSGNTFATYTPTLTATFSFSNQTYSLPTAQISTGTGLSFGTTSNGSGSSAVASALFPTVNSFSSPSNSNFTSSTSVTAGTGIDISANKAVEIFTSARPLYNASSSTSGRYYFGDLTITFNQAVTNPIIHVVGLGGTVSSLGMSTELELQNSGISLSKLSGSSELTISSGTKILNGASSLGSSTGSGAASGSVLATGSGISSLTFRVYMRGDGSGSNWGSSSMHAGDVWLIGVSLNAPVSISGNVYNDANGLTNSKVDGTGNGKPSSTQLYANLLDNSGKVLTSVAVNADGTYTFSNVASNTNYTIQVSTNQGTNGSSAPTTALPSGWTSTGEYLGNGTGNDGTVDGRLAVAVASTNVTNANFGIDQVPTSSTKWYAIGNPALNSTLVLNGSGLMPGALAGSDGEDGSLGSSKKVAITSLPTGGNELWYNGVKVTKGADGINPPSVSNPYVIAAYTINNLAIKFTGTGSSQTVFNYAFYDAAGVMSVAASYTISWTSILPVKLVSFSASLNGNKVGLQWTTATEENLSHFVVEKSLDGTNFSDAGIVFANGNSTSLISYNFVDNDINSSQKSVIYYRLRSVDNDGKYSYSETRIIRISTNDAQAVAITAYPNPAISSVNVTIPANWQNKKVSYELFANNGQVIYKNDVGAAGQTEAINVSKLAPGFYFLRVSCEGSVAQQKIVKQ